MVSKTRENIQLIADNQLRERWESQDGSGLLKNFDLIAWCYCYAYAYF